ncbi:MAG: substrate-binding domain-containing protein, partial [Desulfobacterales bacterium]|nr:substrate-binding domain-containing protein [Desulfobacterales bacterium]
LIVKKGNPLSIKDLVNVQDKHARFINRNEGSGTRMLLEYFMRQLHLNERDIRGFFDVVNTHLEVALKVFFDEADVGMGIEYITHLLPLDFIPLTEERFDLVIPKNLWPTAIMQDFITYLQPEKISKLSHKLPGYNLKETGKVLFES